MILLISDSKIKTLNYVRTSISFDNEEVHIKVIDFISNSFDFPFYIESYWFNLFSVSSWNDFIFFDNIDIYSSILDLLK